MTETPSRIERRHPFCAYACTQMIARLFLIISIAGCSTTAHDRRTDAQDSMLDIIWKPLPPLKHLMPQRDQHYSQLILSRWVESCSDFKFKVADEQYVWLEPDYSAWSAIAKSYTNMLSSRRFNEQPITLDCDVPGYHPLSVWSVDFGGEIRYIAISMTDSPVPGAGDRRLFGRFELQRVRAD